MLLTNVERSSIPEVYLKELNLKQFISALGWKNGSLIEKDHIQAVLPGKPIEIRKV